MLNKVLSDMSFVCELVGAVLVQSSWGHSRARGGAAYETSGCDMQYDDFEMGGGMRKMG